MARRERHSPVAAREQPGARGIEQDRAGAAVDAMDIWANDNAAAFNSAIPQPARGVLSAKQKAWLLFHVIRRRFELA